MILSPYQKEKLDQLAEIRDPNLRMQRLLTDRSIAEAILKLGNLPGANGYTPIKGKDYFTETEISAIISYIQGQIKPAKPGEKGDKGDSVKGDTGYTPIRGVDYWTAEDKTVIEKNIQKLLKKIEDRLSIERSKPKEELKKESIHYKDIQGAPDLKSLEDLIKFLKMGGFRGGGGGTSFTLTTTGTSGPATLVNSILNIPQYSGGSGTGSIFSETPTGLIDGSNKVYTTVKTITTVLGLWYNGEFVHPSEYTVSGAGFTMTTALPVATPAGALTIVYTNGSVAQGSELTATGTINSSNTAYTFTQKPTYIVADGVYYKVGGGWTWNAGTLTATMSKAPDNTIWGIA